MAQKLFLQLGTTPGPLATGPGTLSIDAAGSPYLTAVSSDVFIPLTIGDETTDITTGTAKVTFRSPFAFTLTEVRASLSTASSSGLPAIDVKNGGTSVFSTTVTINANATTSVGATTPAVIANPTIADNALMTVDIAGAGTGAKGLKLVLKGTRSIS